jgi:tRNA dimethylallyltransferase
MIKICCLVGPTGVGKTEVAIELAKKFDLDIISADSRQIYKYMDIGTAKPSSVVRDRVRFHLIDIITPDILYSAADFARDCTKVIDKIIESKRKLAPPLRAGAGFILVGGSGLYLKALFEPFFIAPPRDLTIRRLLEKKSIEELYEFLKIVDPKSTKRINPSDRQRIVRALELYQMTRKPLSEHIRGPYPVSNFSPYYVGLNLPRKALYKKIDARFDKMIDDGLIDEVLNLIRLGYDENFNAMNAIGYQEILKFINHQKSLTEAIEIAKTRSRQYAKRQMTWFKKVDGIKWIEYTSLEETTQKVTQQYEKYLKLI